MQSMKTNQPENLPRAFIERLTQIVPKAALESVLASFCTAKPVCFRVNTLKSTIQDVIQQLTVNGFNITPTTPLPNAFFVPASQRRQLTHSPEHEQGLIYLQNLSSQLPPLLLDPQPGEEILDLAAAPGSKTTQIAALMQNQGRVAAVEKVRNRFFKLKDNLAQQGVTIAATYLKDGSSVYRSCKERFDRVLLDAPCSSEARFDNHDPRSFHYWSEAKIKEMQRKQWPLLYSAFQSLKPGGTLVYATCSFAPEENEAIVNKLLKKFPNTVEIAPIELALPNTQPGLTAWQHNTFLPAVSRCLRILPTDQMSGFFLCKIHKSTSLA